MKSTTPLACSILMLVSSFLFSCRKDNNPTPPTKQPTGTVTINLSYGNTVVNNFELIISSLGGTILLDTAGTVGTSILATLRTHDQRFNVTVVQYDSTVGEYTANTYTAVNPTTWTKINDGPASYISPIYEPPSTAATLHYYNAPYGQSPYFINGPAPELSVVTPGASTVDVSYQRHTGAYTYLLFPGTGQYVFHLPQTDADSVDLSNMGSTVNMTFAKPAGAQLEFTNLEGYMDTTDFSKYLWLYFSPDFPDGYDLEYPPTLVQKYEFAAGWQIAPKTSSGYYSFATTIPPTGSIPFVSESNYTIGSSQADSFAIQFNNIHPSYYETQWTTNRIVWNIFSSADSAVQHPLSLLTAQKSRLLNGQSLSSLALTGLMFENAQGASYDWYLGYIFNPSLLNKKLLGTSIILQKTF